MERLGGRLYLEFGASIRIFFLNKDNEKLKNAFVERKLIYNSVYSKVF